MSILHHNSTASNFDSCRCYICLDREAREQAIALGMTHAPEPDADPDLVVFCQTNRERRYRDEDAPGESEGEGRPPSENDRTWWAGLNDEGSAEWELSPWEEALEVFGEPAWNRACREHAAELERLAMEAAYYERLDSLGGVPQEWDGR